jgi:type II secretory pathway predicted ATPase ExeA
VFVIVGAAGTGKTLLCRHVKQAIEPGAAVVSVVEDPQLGCDELIRHVLNDFGAGSTLPSRVDALAGHDLVRALQQFLAALAPTGIRAAIVIDAAERLQPSVLERIRLLSNFETDSDKLLQIVLVGRPDLHRVLDAPELRQLRQRISRRYLLAPLDTREVRPYIERRLWVAHGGVRAKDAREGATFWRAHFTAAAIRAVARLTGGTPGAINALCGSALESAARRGQARVDARDVVSAAGRLAIAVPLDVRLAAGTWPRAAAAIACVAAAATLTASLAWDGSADAPGGLSPAAIAANTSSSGSRGGGARDEADAVDAGTTVSPLVEIESFTVVAGSFRSPERAAELAARVAESGLPAFTRTVSGAWHQVIVGPYASVEEARGAQQRLGALQIRDAEIVATPPDAG